MDGPSIKIDLSHIPHACGVYLMRGSGSDILYIGKARDLSRRVGQYFNPGRSDFKNAALVPLIRRIDYIPCASEREALLLEKRLIASRRPFFNISLKDDKTYPYVKITFGEDFPRILFTRRRVEDGGTYFGPFPKVSPMRGLLRHIQRNPALSLRPCRWDFGFDKPLAPKKINSCLYYHTGTCPAPCAGLISPEDYRRRAENAALFFSGNLGRLTRRFRKEMKAASRALEYERAAQLRDMTLAFSQIRERVRARRVKAEDLEAAAAGSRAVTDLQQALGLSKPPFHIECFDVSHFQGRQTAASMTCFMGGEPNKDHYRRFRIREVSSIDDFRSMAEVVRRRYVRLKREGALPDLVLVDGGKGQLGAAAQALKAAGVRIPLAALAKRLEEIFQEGRAGSLLLDRSRPALRLLQRLRDEAHRFGIRYHRLLRGKALLEESSPR